MTALATLNPISQYFDFDGSPLDAGYLYFGAVGQNPVTSPQTVYWDAAGAQPAAQPIRTLNGYPMRGGAPAIVYAAADYSLLVSDKRGRQVFYGPTSAEFANSSSIGARLDNLSANDSATKGAGMVGFGALAYGPGTVGGALFTTVWGDGSTDNSAAVAAANALGYPIRFVGASRIVAPTTITAPIVDTMGQIFTTGSLITINNGLPVRPEWFGSAAGNIRLAVNAQTAGGVVLLANRRYPPSYNTLTAGMVAGGTGVAGVDYLAKRIKIIGAGEPQRAADESAYIDGTGTIVEGPFYSHGDGQLFEGFHVDSGAAVCAARYGGTAQDAFAAVQVNKASPAFAKTCFFDRIGGLCKDRASAVHAVLIEAVDGFWIGKLDGMLGIHGVVIKSQNGTARELRGYKCDTNPVILKSESWAPCNNVEVGTIVGDTSLDAAVRIQAATTTMAGIKVGKVLGLNSAIGLTFDGANITSDVIVSALSTYSCAKGVRRVNQTRAAKITEAVISNATTSAYEDVSGIAAYSFNFATLECLNGNTGVVTNGLTVVDKYLSTGTTSYDINYTATGARVLLGTVRRASPGQAKITNSNPSLAGSWVGVAGQSSFDIQLDSYGVRFKGLVTGGTGTIFNLSAQMRPGENFRHTVHGWNPGGGGSAVVGSLLIATNGDVTIESQPAAASAWWNLDGVLLPGTYI